MFSKVFTDLRNLTLSNRHRRAQTRYRNIAKSRLGCESLEDRRVMAAIHYAADTQSIIIVGTAGNDAISVQTNGQFVNVADKSGGVVRNSRYFRAADVDQLLFAGGYGNDSFDNATQIPAAMWGGPGGDLLVGGWNADRMYGESGNDTILDRGGNDVAEGGDGNDYLVAADGADAVRGGEGSDLIRGGGGNDSLHGEGGDDRIEGQDGNDLIRGGYGHDVIDGGTGAIDVLYGEYGNDFITGGGSGQDYLFGGAGDDILLGSLGPDRLFGEDGNDIVSGEQGHDAIFGGTGHDVLGGGVGRDHLEGGTGRDVLVGGADVDQLWGQADYDVFGYDRADLTAGGAVQDSGQNWFVLDPNHVTVQRLLSVQPVGRTTAQNDVVSRMIAPVISQPVTSLNWQMSPVVNDTKALTALALVPTVMQQTMNVMRTSGVDAAGQFLRYALSNDYLTDLMEMHGLGHIANLTATADVARAIYEDPLVNRIIQGDRDAIFLVGPGFTPQMHRWVTSIIERMPGTRGVHIDLVRTAMLAGLPQLVPMMQTITNPGAAFVAQTGISPTTTYPMLATSFMQMFSPGTFRYTNPYQTIPLLAMWGGPVG
jgi:hypothetical protein